MDALKDPSPGGSEGDSQADWDVVRHRIPLAMCGLPGSSGGEGDLGGEGDDVRLP